MHASRAQAASANFTSARPTTASYQSASTPRQPASSNFTSARASSGRVVTNKQAALIQVEHRRLVVLILAIYRAATASYQSSASAPPRQQSASSNFGSAKSSTGSYQQASSSQGGGSSGSGSGGNFGRSSGPPSYGGGSSSKGASNNSDFRDGLKLNIELRFKETGLLDQGVKLTTNALQCIKDSDNRIKDGDKLNNKQVIDRLTKNGEPIENWAKYKTSSVTLGTGNRAQIHFYYNNRTGEVVQDIDCKVKGGFGLKKDDVSLFSRNPEKEPISQKDACHTLSL